MLIPLRFIRTSQAVRLVHHPAEKTIIVSATKGIENETHLTMSGILLRAF